MKTYITLAVFLLSFSVFAQQPNPDCNHLKVSAIQMDNDTAKLMKITVNNTCSNCASALNGCVYMQLEVIRTVAPFDTLASSYCWCLWTPVNNGQRTYSVNSTVASLPPLNTLRIGLSTWSCGCDSMSFVGITGITSFSQSNTLEFYPNPAKDYVVIKEALTSDIIIRITDLTGKILVLKKQERYSETIEISQLETGIYILEVLDQQSGVIKRAKLSKS